MIARFEELDWQETRMGELTLRRRADPATGELIYEVKLKDEYLMSSLFTVAEEELATLGLAAAEGVDLDVLVGGLGLGYTAATALHDDRVRRLDVIDALPAVIGWHERELLPVSAQLVRDPRTTLVHDDFFAVVRRPPEPDGRAVRRHPARCRSLPAPHPRSESRRPLHRGAASNPSLGTSPTGASSPCGRTIRPTTTS